jgi:MFS family permease
LAAIIWLFLSQSNPLGHETWRIMFALGVLPAFICLYLRRSLEESERWVEALKKRHWAATDEDERTGAAPKVRQRPFTLAEVFREPESRRRVLLSLAMSFSVTVALWAVSALLPAYTEALAKSLGQPANTWGARIGTIYNAGAICAYILSGFIADAFGRRYFLLFAFVGSIITTVIPTHGPVAFQCFRSLPSSTECSR